MGFLTGVITGIAAAVLAAAWYLSRSGQPIRQRYRIEERLATLGDELDIRSRAIRTALDRQLGDLRGASDAEASAEAAVDETLDPVAASAAEAEAAAVLEAGIDQSTGNAPTKRARKPTSATPNESAVG